MKKLLILLAIIGLLASCETKTQKIIYACTCEQQQKVSDNIKSSIKSANNMSDEEMEDVIIQLEKTFVRTNCQQKLANIIIHDGWVEITQQDSCITYYNY